MFIDNTMPTPHSFRNNLNISTSDLWLASNVSRQSTPSDKTRWFNLSNFFFDDGFEGTPGSILFIGADGRVAEDNPNLFYDNTNDRLGVNAGTTPSANLHVNGTVRFENLSGSGTALTIDTNGYITRTTAYTGTVTSVSATVPTGFSITGSPVTGSGTLAISNSFTSGSIVFAMGTGFAQDNSNFFWDDTNNRLGLGVNSGLLSRLHIKNPGTGTTINAIYAETSVGANILQVATDSAATFALLGSTSFTENTLRINGPAAPTATGITYTTAGTDKFRSQIRSDNNFQFTAVDAGSSSIGGFHIENATGKLLLKEKIYQYNAVAPTNGQILMGHTANGSFELGTISAGSGISITNGAGSIQIASTVSASALTKVDDTNVTLTLGGSPTTALLAATSLTLGWTGTLAVSRGGTGISSFGTGIATWLGTPSSANLATAITDETGSGSLVFATSPTLVTPVLGVASSTSETITGTGGSGFLQLANQASAPSTPTTSTRIFADSSNRLSWKGTNGFVRTFDGTANTADRVYVLPDAGGTVALTANKLSVFAATTSAELAGVISDETGSGSLVFATSPTLVTPNIGVASGTSLALTSTIGTYKNITTANNGVGCSVGTPVHLTAQTSAIGATTLYTTTEDGFYQVKWCAAITTAATSSSTLGHFQIQWTNVADNVVKTTPTQNNVTASAANITTGTGSCISGCFTVYAKSGTNISYVMAYTSSGATAMRYSLDITVFKL